MTEPTQHLGDFLFSFLREQGVRHCFGIPGDYILPLYDALERAEGIEAVVATHEPCAAFSADGYARLSGLGVLLVTYGVGAYNALNGVAGAYAESSPLLVISGGPARGYVHGEDLFTPMRHHVVKRATGQLEVYQRVTDLALRLESAEGAAEAIRRAASHARQRQLPVYLEIPTDLMTAPIPVPSGRPAEPAVDRESLEHAVQAFVARISAASQPVLLVGVEAARHRLQPELRRMMASGGMPAVTTVLGKAVLPEGRDGALGVYAGVLTPAIQTRRLVESSDLVVMLGAEVTDVDCGAFTADLKRDRLLVARSGWVGDGYSRYASELPFAAFVRALAAALPDRGGPPLGPCPAGFDYDRSESQMDRYLGVVAAQLQEDDIIVADTGDSCFGSLWITTRRQGGYLAPTFYNSMGFAIPVALGAQLADPSGRPIVLAGDGAFQMTGLELSNMVRRRLDPIVLVFNNGGYGMQRIFVDGPFNDIGAWDYTRIPELLGGGQARRVASPAELAEAIERARAFRGGPSLIEVVVAKGVISTGLRVFGQALRREKTGACPLGAEGAGPCQHRDYCAFCRATIWRS